MRFIIYTLLACAYFVSSVQAEGLVYVDLQRAVFEVDDGKSAKKRLEKMKSQRQKALDGQQKELKSLQEDLEKRAQFLPADQKVQKENEFKQKLGALQATYAKLQRELAEEEMKIQQKILGKMEGLLEKLGQEQNYSMIVRKDALLWAPSHLEITNEVIRRYNNTNGKKGKKNKKSKKRKRSKKKK
jgi:outer membrane protein